MTNYVLGFLFDSEAQNVLLIEKKKPEWQAGRMNGIGGKIESDESPFEAMIREFKEETSWKHPLHWKYFANLTGQGWKVWFFCSSISHKYLCEIESEESEIVSVCNALVHTDNRIPNLRWLIPMAIGFVLNEVSILPGLNYYELQERS
jgi:8-oxo-dGTP diphosphatase